MSKGPAERQTVCPRKQAQQRGAAECSGPKACSRHVISLSQHFKDKMRQKGLLSSVLQAQFKLIWGKAAALTYRSPNHAQISLLSIAVDAFIPSPRFYELLYNHSAQGSPFLP